MNNFFKFKRKASLNKLSFYKRCFVMFLALLLIMPNTFVLVKAATPSLYTTFTSSIENIPAVPIDGGMSFSNVNGWDIQAYSVSGNEITTGKLAIGSIGSSNEVEMLFVGTEESLPLSSIEFSPNSGEVFDLKSIDLTTVGNQGSISLIGYRNGSPVSGAILTRKIGDYRLGELIDGNEAVSLDLSIANPFIVSNNANFSGIDKFVIKCTGSGQINGQIGINNILTANFRSANAPSTHTVTFEDYNGTVLRTQTVTEGGAATAPAAPTRTGYTFAGWDKTFTNITADTVVKATYTQNTSNNYTVTFEDYNGTVLRTQTVTEGGAATAPAAPTRTGYTFAGWDKTFTNITADTVVKATYTQNTSNNYTVTFEDYDGTVLRTQTVTEGGAATAPAAPTRTGYTFAGWDKTFTNITADTVVKATYTQNTSNNYTVTFEDYNGTVLRTQTVTEGGAATAPAAPTRTGYTFAGWDKTFTNITADIIVKATYTQNTSNNYTVTFEDYNGTVLRTQTVTEGGAATAPAAPTRTGYTFAGWDKTFTNITADTVVKATYTQNTSNNYTVTFEDYDGTVLRTQTVTEGGAATAPAAPTRTGYTFAGWDKTFTNITADTVVKATYTQNTSNNYTVTFEDYNGTVLRTQTVTEGGAATAPAAPTRTGYTFAGWDKTFTNITADTVVKATYTQNTSNNYTVTFEDYNGTVLRTQTVTEGGAATAPAAPTRTGYTFAGWDKTFTNITADTVVKATYTQNTSNNYTVTFEDYNGTVLRTQTVTEGGAATAPAAPTRTGYTFAGWDKTFTNITADTVVKATYTQNTSNNYTVTFEDYDGTVLKTQAVTEGGSAAAPAAPTREGYTFTGWDKTFTNITADTVVKATYTQNTSNNYTVIFEDYDGTVLKTQAVTEGGSAAAPAAPTREGYTFTGWDKTFTNITADTVVKAVYKGKSSGGGGSTSSTGSTRSSGTTTPTTVTGKVVDDETGSQVSNITATVTEDNNSNKTVTMKVSDAIVIKQPNGINASFTDLSKVDIKLVEGTQVEISSDGTIKVENLPKGTDNNYTVSYDLGNGQKIVMGTINIKVSSSGDVSLTSTLIDPYGVITDSSTGKVIEGANVVLYYANTDRNKAAGKTPGTIVNLPNIDGFKPNDNKNPQFSDAAGTYGFMVFPTSDYYIVATKDGYYKYTSPTISVEQRIIKWDIRMNPNTAESQTNGIIRLAGQDRIESALSIAKANYPGKISNVVFATAGNFPDALTGTPLAYKLNAPILLVGSTDADQEKILAYIKANMDVSGNVYILGGYGAVSKSFEDKVISNGYSNITRLGGADRYETSAKIAEKLNVNSATPAFLASGEDYPDSLAISSIAAVNGYPILLVQKDGISDAVKKQLAAIVPEKVYILGLQGAVSSAVESQVPGIVGIDENIAVRIGGTDRFKTSLEIAKYFKLDGNSISIATGNNFPDALAGSVYAAKHNSPIILVDKTLSDGALSFAQDRKISGADIFGGEGAVSKDVEQQLSQIIGK